MTVSGESRTIAIAAPAAASPGRPAPPPRADAGRVDDGQAPSPSLFDNAGWSILNAAFVAAWFASSPGDDRPKAVVRERISWPRNGVLEPDFRPGCADSTIRQIVDLDLGHP
jgi:hypothetical protein